MAMTATCNVYTFFLFALQFSEIFGKYLIERNSINSDNSLILTTAIPYHLTNPNNIANNSSNQNSTMEGVTFTVVDSRTLPPKVVGGAIGGGLGGGVGGAVGGGVGYLFGGPIGGGVGGAIGGGKKSKFHFGKGVGGAIGGKIGGGNGAAIGAGIGGALGGGIGGFIAGPIGGGLGGLLGGTKHTSPYSLSNSSYNMFGLWLGGGVGGAVGASELPEVITHEENVPGFPKRNITAIFVPNDDDDNDSTTESRNLANRLKHRFDKLKNRLTILVTT